MKIFELKKSKHKQEIVNTSCGRSMVEMLGVLAIIGVLSVGALAGYSKAMEKYKINKTVNEITHIAMNIREFHKHEQNYDAWKMSENDYNFNPEIVKKLNIFPEYMWQGDDAIFEVRNYINNGEFIDFLIPNTLENLRLTLTSFEDAETGEITSRVSAGQGKKIRIKPEQWPMPVAEVKRLLPQYVIARKQGALSGDNKDMYDRKLEEFDELCGK